MPSVYTIEGVQKRRRKKKKKKRSFSPDQKRAQARMKRAAKRCKGLKKGKYVSCMRRELKK